jgi:hypothetical protein
VKPTKQNKKQRNQQSVGRDEQKTNKKQNK